MPEIGAISFSGLATGMDTKNLIKELVRIAREPIRRLERNRAREEKKVSVFQELHSKLLAVRTAAKKLLTEIDFFVRADTLSDETALGASVTSTAQVGFYNITISALAKGGQETFVGVADHTAQDLSGTFTIQNASTNPTSFSISIDATGKSLQELRDAINSDANNDGYVTATILDRGSGANRYVLQIKANTPGTQNDLDVTATASLSKDTNANVTFAAVDASFSVDGVSFTRSTNTVSDAISGVTLSLKTETITAVTLTVSNDAGAIQSNIKTFISAYNDVLSYVKGKSTLDQKNPQNNGPLFGDATVRGITSRLQQRLTAAVAGLAEDYNALHDLGITTGTDGKFVIDETTLAAALAADTDKVGKIFMLSGGISGVADRVDEELAGMTDAVGGLLDIRVDGLQERIATLNDRMDTMERRITTYESTLTRQFAALERLVNTLQSQGTALGGFAFGQAQR